MLNNPLLTFYTYRKAKKSGLSGKEAITASMLGQSIAGSNIAASSIISDRLVKRKVRLRRPGRVIAPPPVAAGAGAGAGAGIPPNLADKQYVDDEIRKVTDELKNVTNEIKKLADDIKKSSKTFKTIEDVFRETTSILGKDEKVKKECDTKIDKLLKIN